MHESVQHVEERVLSPLCWQGQHDDCKVSLSFVGEDGVGRSMICPCRCHDHAPTVTSGANPAVLYLISWEYEVRQKSPEEGKPDLTAWIRRKVLATTKDLAGDWLDSISELTKTNQVRNLVTLKAPLGTWEKVGS
jgi:hypothetical protein